MHAERRVGSVRRGAARARECVSFDPGEWLSFAGDWQRTARVYPLSLGLLLNSKFMALIETNFARS